MDDLRSLVEQCRGGEKDYQALVDRVPYAGFLGIQVQARGREISFLLPAADDNVGNPMLPALHGGAVAGFMEQSAIIYLLLEMGEPRVPKTIDFTVDYLRSGHLRDTWADCRVTRLGRRIANVHVSAWQQRQSEPIAIARSHFLLSDDH